MYHQYFGLVEAPFSIAVDPRYLYMSSRHRDALAHLLYGVGTGGGFILLTGEVGTGKTTINRCLLAQLPEDTDVAIVLNPALNALELLATVCDELSVEYQQGAPTLKSLTDALHGFLLANFERGRKTVLMIDEAQHLDFEVLEQIRLLTNLETDTQKLLQIILIGQPELAEMLARPELRQLNQRITARYDLSPLTLEETRAYIEHRLQVAGLAGGRSLFPPPVVKDIHRMTRGIPRLINMLCDRSLLGAYGQGKAQTDRTLLQAAANEVLGASQLSTPRWWPRVAALGVPLVLAVAAGIWWLQSDANQAPVASAELPTAAQVPAQAPTTPQADAAAPLASLPTTSPAPAPLSPQDAPDSVIEAGAADAGTRVPLLNRLHGPEHALAALWRLYGKNAPAVLRCGAPGDAALACVTATAATWNQALAHNRPVALSLVTPQRFAASAVLLAANATELVLWQDGAEVIVASTELAPLWSGEYRFLWQPPRAFREPLSRGDRDPAVAEVAALFARLDGQAQPLADTLFNSALEQRVRLFQRSVGLDADGIIGEQTLLKLNELLGIDPDPSSLRLTLAEAAAGATP